MLDENNLSFLGDFATGIDYVLDDEGELAFEYHVSLSQVERCLVERENRIFSLS
jgi:hypothetical protein